MEICRFNKTKDWAALELLDIIRNGTGVHKNNIPKIGYIVSEHNKLPIAVGFLRRIEGGFGMLDTFITNPNYSSEDRHKALNLLTNILIRRADNLNLTGLICHTSDNGIIERSKSLGFKAVNQSIIALSLKE